MKKIGIALFAFILIGTGLAPAWDDGQASEKEKSIYDAAKKAVYEKQWQQAAEAFAKLAEAYPKSLYAAESLYWKSYSLNKLASGLEDMEARLKTKEFALQDLETMLAKYAASNWIRDAKLLQIEIAENLVKNGMGQYSRYIDRGVLGGGSGVEGGVQSRSSAPRPRSSSWPSIP
jgi:hypothetical protein